MSTKNERFILHFSEERKRLKLSQQEAADKCDVTRQTWGLYERGLATPSGEVLLKFQELGADIAYIFEACNVERGEIGDADAIKILHKAYETANTKERAALEVFANLILNKQK